MLVPVLLAVLAVIAVMTCRFVVPCSGDPGCFVVAGAQFTDPVEAGLPVLSEPEDDGYDGQFFWRLSRSPHELGLAPVHGVALDTPIRVGRPAYPALVWAASGGGRAGIVDWMMIVVNVVMTGLLCLLLASTARRHGVSPWIGAAAALWPGLLFAVGRDLSEPGSAFLVVAGLAALHRERPALAGLAWTVAVLWREQALILPAAYGCWWAITLLRRRASARSFGALWPWLAPLAAFVTWQAVAAAAVGTPPIRASGEQNAVLPLTGLIAEMSSWTRLEEGVTGLVWLLELAIALTIVVSAIVVGARSRRWEVLAVVAGLLLLLSASSNVWGGPAHLRYATDLVATAWFVLLSPSHRAGTLRRLEVGDVASPKQRRTVGGLVGWRSCLVVMQLGAAVLACSYLVRTP